MKTTTMNTTTKKTTTTKTAKTKTTKVPSCPMFRCFYLVKVVYKVSLSYKSIFDGLALPEIWLNIVVLPF